jgi:TolB protein
MKTLLVMLAAAVLSPVTELRDSYPSVSSDGKTLLFQSNRSGRQAIWAAAADGSLPRLLLDGGAMGSAPATPSWSPDGSRFVFGMWPADAALDDESEIYVADASGTNVRRLTTAPGDDSHPHWSADGLRIFFNSARSTPDLKADWGDQWIDIYSMAADGSDVRRITDCRTVCTYPVPSPDGRWIVHRKIIDAPGRDWGQAAIPRNSEVFVTSIDGRTTRNLSDSPAYDGWPVWTADGRWILFASNRDGEPRSGQILAVRPDGTALIPLTAGSRSRVQPFPTNDSRVFVYELVEGPSGEFGHIAVFPLALPR